MKKLSIGTEEAGYLFMDLVLQALPLCHPETYSLKKNLITTKQTKQY